VTRRLGLIVVLLLVAAAGSVFWWWSARRPQPVMWQGYAEADFIKVGPTQSGLLTSVNVARGDAVAVGSPLFAQDDVDDQAARDQAARQLEQAEQQLANFQQGGKPTEIAQAEANLADTNATLARTAIDLTRGEAQLPSGGVSKQSVDQMKADHLSAQAKMAGMQAALAQAKAPMGREGEIQAQLASVAAFRAALAMADWRLTQRRVTAPATGRVADVLARPGETMTAGAPVVSLLPPENIFVRFFVPEAALATLHQGDAVAFACDRCGGGLTGTVSFISPQAEYTPPLIYSESSRSKLVFLIEARPPRDKAVLFNPGEPVEVRPIGVRAP
jgi:HlyD family secretion protein